MKALFVLNGAPYGDERSFNSLRLATALGKREGVELRVFLMGDAVGCALAGQQTPEGSYNLGRMVRGLAARGTTVGLCGTCLDTRGLGEARFVDGVQRSTMEELADWVTWADKVVAS